MGERDYYVSLVRGRRVSLLAGPFETHAQALAMVDNARTAAEAVDPFAHFDACGTLSIERYPWNKKGVLNAKLGVDSP